jgi:hypothetical protein
MDSVRMLLVSLAAICFVGAGCSDSDDDIVASTPTVAPSATPVPPPPAENGYRTIQILPQANFERMISFSLLPDRSDEALLATQGGLIYRIPIEAALLPFSETSRIYWIGRGDGGSSGDSSCRRISLAMGAYSSITARRTRRACWLASGCRRRLDPNSRRVILEVEQPTSINIAGGLAWS